MLSVRKDNTIHISTFDSFLTEFIVTPHGKRRMGCVCSPFLISGAESFLEWTNYKIYAEANIQGRLRKIPFKIDELCIKPNGDKIAFYVRKGNAVYDIEQKEAYAKIALAGKLGGYTHPLRSLWAAQILDTEPRLVDIISKKFPYIIID